MNQTANQLYKSNEQVIQDTFLSLLKEKDISRITVREICEKANINRSTFYRHHEDIYALMKTVQKNIFMDFVDEFRSLNERDEYVSLENLTLIVKHVQKHKDFYSTYLANQQTFFYGEKRTHLWEEFFVPMFQTYGIQNERYMQYYYEYFHAGCISCIRKWVEDGCIETPEELATIIWSYSRHEENEIL